MNPFDQPSGVAQLLAEVREMHERILGPIREAMPKPDPNQKPIPSADDVAEILRPAPAQNITINVFINQDSEQ